MKYSKGNNNNNHKTAITVIVEQNRDFDQVVF